MNDHTPTQLALPFSYSERLLSRADRAIMRHVDGDLVRVDFETGLIYKRPDRPTLGKINHDGYLRVTLNDPDWRNQVPVFIHRIIAYANWGNRLFDLEVNHINEIKSDNRLSNLELVTRDQNMQHSMNGAKNHMAILTAEQVREIRRRYKFRGGVDSGKELAREFGVCKQLITSIIQRKIWKHVP